MKQLFLFLKDIKVYFRAMLIILVISIVLAFVFSLVIIGGKADFGPKSFVRPFTVAIYNEGDSLAINVLIQKLSSVNIIKNTIKVSSEKEGLSLIDNKVAAAFFVISRDAFGNVYNGQRGNVKLYSSSYFPLEASIMKTTALNIDSVLNSGAASMFTIRDRIFPILGFDKTNAEMAKMDLTIIQTLASRKNTINESSGSNPVSPLNFYLSTSVMLFALFIAMISARMFSADIRDGIILRQYKAGISPLSAMLSKSMLFLSFSLLGIIAMYIIAAKIIKIDFFFNPLSVLWVFIFCYFCFAGVFYLITSLFNFNASEMINILLVLFFSVGGGILYPTHLLPDFLRSISDQLPSGIGMNALYEVVSLQGNDLLKPVFLLAMFGLISFIACAVVIKMKIKRFGKA